MPKVNYPGGADGSIGRYGKGRSTLVDSFWKRPEAGTKVRIK